MEKREEPLSVFCAAKVKAIAKPAEMFPDETDCLVVYGSPVLCVDADLRAIEYDPQEMRSANIDATAAASSRLNRAVREFPAPVTSAVMRVAVSDALKFALPSDLVHVHENAVFNTVYA